MIDSDVIIAAADHPSLDDGVADLLATLRAEPRFFGPTASTNPKPFPSFIDHLGRRGAFRFAAIGYDRVVGLVRIDHDGDVLVAVDRGRRGRGIGTLLLETAAAHAEAFGLSRLVLRTTHRSEAVRRAADRVGAVAVDQGRGRLDLILPVRSMRPSA